jgi:hypothetical protein
LTIKKPRRQSPERYVIPTGARTRQGQRESKGRENKKFDHLGEKTG